MQAVSLTAQWTAAIRALESERADGSLFRDDLARRLAQPDGFDLLNRYRGAGVREFVVIRTRYFDDAARRALAESTEIRQVVLVAAGMDTRAYRLSWPEGTTIFEVDHGDLLAEKAARLAGSAVGRGTRRVEVPADLAVEWMRPLIEAGFDLARPALWLVEGLLFFLTEEQARGLLCACARTSASGSRLVADMTSGSLLRSPFSQGFLSTLREDGIPWRFGTDEPERLLAELGWTVLDLREPGTVEAGQQYWPYKTQPRKVSGVARSWLATAELVARSAEPDANVTRGDAQ